MSIPRQRLTFFQEGQAQEVFVISTSRRLPCNRNGSQGTPLGWHEISEKIGDDAPLGMIFKARRPLGTNCYDLPPGSPDENLITTRILRLRGLEPGVNVGGDLDTHSRYIYIHGTNREADLGQPQSAGCILMANAEIAAFFPKVAIHDLVFIER